MMTNLPLFFFMMTASCMMGKTKANNFYWQPYPASQGVYSIPQLVSLSDIVKPDCDKNKATDEEKSSESSSSESSSSESSSSESSSGVEGSSEKIKKESKGNGNKEEIKETPEESKSSDVAKSEEGSNEKAAPETKAAPTEKPVPKEKAEPEAKAKPEAKAEPEEKATKKKSKDTKYIFPPRSYAFPARQVQQPIYSSSVPYAYLPYRASYLVQQPVSTYPANTNYQYISIPASAVLPKAYTAPQAAISTVVKSPPTTNIVYSTPAINYPAVSKMIISPGARVYTAPVSWKTADANIAYYKI